MTWLFLAPFTGRRVVAEYIAMYLDGNRGRWNVDNNFQNAYLANPNYFPPPLDRGFVYYGHEMSVIITLHTMRQCEAVTLLDFYGTNRVD